MDINELLQGVNCTCGQQHKCDIKHVAIYKGAISSLANVAEEYDDILLVADENTYRVAGEKTIAALAGKHLKKVIFPGSTILIPNEEAIRSVNDQLDGMDFIVGIGSGVIQDLCKYVSHVSGIPCLHQAAAQPRNEPV